MQQKDYTGQFVLNMESSNSIADDMKSMINSETLSDIVLKFGSERKSLYAHKLILSARSVVLNKMFTGPMATTNTSIQINECSFDEFLQILHYCYTDKLRLNRDSVWGIMAAANYYEIRNLEEICCDFIIGYLSVDNVCDIYEASSLLTNKLTVACLEMIDVNVQQIIDRGYFLQLEKSTLEVLLARDQLSIREFDLCVAVSKWISQNNESWDKLWKLIRFPTMTTSEFSFCSHSHNNMMFTSQQIADIQRFIKTKCVPAAGLPFSSVERDYYSNGLFDFPPDGSILFYWYDSCELHSVELIVRKVIEITRFEFVHCENHLPDSIIYGIELSDYECESFSFYKGETSKPYIDPDDGCVITLMPDVKYTLTSWVTWETKHVDRRKDDYCVFNISEVPRCRQYASDGEEIEEEEDDEPFRILYNGDFQTFVSKIFYKVLK